ncbi:MAG: PIG-L deacetylase family protein [Bryobacteraceae bacterium]
MLSPHRDDAVFSLCLCMLRWARGGISVRVATFFTRSAYAPRSPAPEPGQDRCGAVSLLREREDRAALSGIARAIGTESFGFLDAPLRLGIAPSDVCGESARQLDRSGMAERLTAAVVECVRGGLVLAPLGLGGHVDHLAIWSAAISASAGLRNLGFYEDLPYATWTAEDALRERVRESERRAGVLLRPAVIRENRPIGSKRRVVSRYESQITPREADIIARFGSRYGGGERIWIPKCSGKWNLLLKFPDRFS